MLPMQWRIGWAAVFLLAIASLVFGAPHARAAFDRATTLTKSSNTGYLLYPRTAICAPLQAEAAAAAAGTQATRRYWARPTRTANAVMPPTLGQTLNAESLSLGPRLRTTLPADD